MNNPFFTIIIPSYNRAEVLPLTIKSVIKQTYTNWELIIVDDGSTDNTKQIVNRISDNRIKYIYQENSERSAARNNGINHSKGKWVIFLDSDDSFEINHLYVLKTRILENQQKKNDIGFYVTGQINYYVNKEKKIKHKTNINYENIPLFFAKESVVPGRVCISKKILINFKFDENIVIVEDADLWFRISCYFKVEFLNDPTFIYHIYDGNSINVKNNAYLKRLEGLKLTFKKPEKNKLSTKQIREIFSNCYFGIHKYLIARNELAKARALILKSILYYPEHRLKEKIYLLIFPSNQ